MVNIARSIKHIVEMEIMAGNKDVCVAKKSISAPVHQSQGALDKTRKEVEACTKCSLHKTRTNSVFGEGNIKAELMFIGEAPGRDEDKQGKPFVGRAGQLLTDIIAAIGLKREDVYIANILKCRPPDNRNPLPEEITECTPYLYTQIEHIKPKVICTLGKFSSQTLLQTETPISQLRGKFHEYRGIKLMPTYHPAYLLRNSIGKKDVWEDMQLIAKELGLKIPKKQKIQGIS